MRRRVWCPQFPNGWTFILLSSIPHPSISPSDTQSFHPSSLSPPFHQTTSSTSAQIKRSAFRYPTLWQIYKSSHFAQTLDLKYKHVLFRGCPWSQINNIFTEEPRAGGKIERLRRKKEKEREEKRERGGRDRERGIVREREREIGREREREKHIGGADNC